MNWKDYVEIDEKFYRPAEVDTLVGDPTRANTELGITLPGRERD